jgi:pimeloyl-ACP methyl ester carboxylesterase
MDIVLIAGLWLPASVWDQTAARLGELGHRPLPVQLPGVDHRSAATLDDQLAGALAAVDAAENPLVVGHSAASTLAWMVADRRPMSIAGVVMVGGFPSADGSTYADFFDVVDGTMAFPGWEPFEGPDSADLDAATRSSLESMAIPVPAGVARATVTLSDDRRFAVPVTMVCPEYTPDQLRAWLADGDIPELERVEHVTFVDIDSGHWPMVTRSAELAQLLHEVAAAV